MIESQATVVAIALGLPCGIALRALLALNGKVFAEARTPILVAVLVALVAIIWACFGFGRLIVAPILGVHFVKTDWLLLLLGMAVGLGLGEGAFRLGISGRVRVDRTGNQ